MKNKKACLISKFIFDNDTRLQQQVTILVENDFDVNVICYLENEKDIKFNEKVTIHGVSNLGDKDSLLKYIWNTIKFIVPAFVKLQKLSFLKKFDIIIVHTLPELMVFIAFFKNFSAQNLYLMYEIHR